MAYVLYVCTYHQKSCKSDISHIWTSTINPMETPNYVFCKYEKIWPNKVFTLYLHCVSYSCKLIFSYSVSWKYIGPYKVVSRLELTYRVWSKEGKEMVVHHDNLKLCFLPSNKGQIVSPGHESGDFTKVHSLPQSPIVLPSPHRPRGEALVRPHYHLQKITCPLVRYSCDFTLFYGPL